jgi:DNA-binding response OmpR family regulator
MTSFGRILVVDEDRLLLESVHIALDDLNYDITAAQSGKSALKCMTEFQPDLIILDLVSPQKAGQEFLQSYWGKDELKPIIALSSSKYRCSLNHNCPVVEYLPNPFSIDELLTFVTKYLPLLTTA